MSDLEDHMDEDPEGELDEVYSEIDDPMDEDPEGEYAGYGELQEEEVIPQPRQVVPQSRAGYYPPPGEGFDLAKWQVMPEPAEEDIEILLAKEYSEMKKFAKMLNKRWMVGRDQFGNIIDRTRIINIKIPKKNAEQGERDEFYNRMLPYVGNET